MKIKTGFVTILMLLCTATVVYAGHHDKEEVDELKVEMLVQYDDADEELTWAYIKQYDASVIQATAIDYKDPTWIECNPSQANIALVNQLFTNGGTAMSNGDDDADTADTWLSNGLFLEIDGDEAYDLEDWDTAFTKYTGAKTHYVQAEFFYIEANNHYQDAEDYYILANYWMHIACNEGAA